MSIGIYVHIPFCAAKCSYCHFFTHAQNEDLAERYCSAVVREMEHYFQKSPCADSVDSIYFGGGTPSLAPVKGIEAILDGCRNMLSVTADCEVTLEVNPESITTAKAATYRYLGINRVSIGAQSFADLQLQRIGRKHSQRQILNALAYCRENQIENVNLDLMLGLPAQTENDLMSDLAHLVQLDPAHISIYMLDLDPQVPLYHILEKGHCRIPDDDVLADWYLLTRDYLGDQGYEQYEISNFARPGRRSRHNLKYWRRREVLGFGVASHSFDGRNRYANVSNLSAYLRCVDGGESAVEWRQHVLPAQALEETLFLGLRLVEGVDWADLLAGYDASELAGYEASLREMSRTGLIEWHDSKVRLTPQGMLLSNEVFQAFV
jgi:oxygen-independent coproporphyrinogen-3 oxidase